MSNTSSHWTTKEWIAAGEEAESLLDFVYAAHCYGIALRKADDTINTEWLIAKLESARNQQVETPDQYFDREQEIITTLNDTLPDSGVATYVEDDFDLNTTINHPNLYRNGQWLGLDSDTYIIEGLPEFRARRDSDNPKKFNCYINSKIIGSFIRHGRYISVYVRNAQIGTVEVSEEHAIEFLLQY